MCVRASDRRRRRRCVFARVNVYVTYGIYKHTRVLREQCPTPNPTPHHIQMCFKHNLTPFVCANVFVCVCKLKNFAYFSLAGGYGWFTLVHGAKYFAAFFKHNINVYTDVCIYGKYVCWGRYNGVVTIKLIQNCKLFSWLYFVRSSSTRIKYFWLK